MKKPKTTMVLFFLLVAAESAAILSIVPVRMQSPLLTVVYVTCATAMTSFLFAAATGDYSWTDRLWSTVPVLFAWIYAYASYFSVPSTAAALLVTLWGIRLTANFARKGGYTDQEDYRWPILRSRFRSNLTWQAFNFLFIACYQQLLFVCFTLPLWALAVTEPAPLTLSSWLCIVGMLAFLALETVADRQQYSFQTAKRGNAPKRRELEEDYERGFLTHGLFSRSRHPNYLGELGFWWCIFLFGSAGNPPLLGPALLGPVLLTLLFVGSTAFTEQISSSRHPLYEQYKRDTWPIIPRPW